MPVCVSVYVCMVTSLWGVLWLVNSNRADWFITATQVTEGHSGIQHVKQRNLWKTDGGGGAWVQ